MDSLVRKSSRVHRPAMHQLVTVGVDASAGLRSGCRPSTVPVAPGRGAGNLWSARLLFFRERHVCVASG